MGGCQDARNPAAIPPSVGREHPDTTAIITEARIATTTRGRTDGKRTVRLGCITMVLN